jgi:hypothetical protein
MGGRPQLCRLRQMRLYLCLTAEYADVAGAIKRDRRFSLVPLYFPQVSAMLDDRH